MQRCPYIHEMKERLLGQPVEQLAMEPLTKDVADSPRHEPPIGTVVKERLLEQPKKPIIKELVSSPRPPEPPVGTVVKLNADGYGSHTSPTHQCTPLVPHDPEDDFHYYETRTRPKNAKTSLFIIMSFIYAKLLVVVCITYVISDVVTHKLPLYYYEGFFTYLYGMSILFLLYVFCFLLQESSCCNGEKTEKKRKPPKEKKQKPTKEKEKKEDKKDKDKKDKDKDKKGKDKDKDKEKEKEKESGKTKKQKEFQLEVYPRKMRDVVRLKHELQQQLQMQEAALRATEASFNHRYAQSPTAQNNTYRRNSELLVDMNLNAPCSSTDGDKGDDIVADPLPDSFSSDECCIPVVPQEVDIETGVGPKSVRRRKTTQNDSSHGSFFLRIGAIAFGLGTMIYNGLEFGAFFEVPFTSPCYQILRGVNPVLQMVFTFMQMYFIFMNSRLNIHRFKVIARFGLMHVCATNLCVWIRTLVLEYMKEITVYHQKNPPHPNDGIIAESIRQHTLKHAGTVLGTEIGSGMISALNYSPITDFSPSTVPTSTSTVGRALRSTMRTLAAFTMEAVRTTTQSTTLSTNLTTTPRSTTTTTTTTTRATPTTTFRTTPTTTPITTTPSTITPSTEWLLDTTLTPVKNFFGFNSYYQDSNNAANGSSLLDFYPQALVSLSNTTTTVASSQSCGRVNIMGTIVQDSAPYLFPFIIEYSLIGAAVIYVMWKHIGRNPRCVTEEDLEHRLEVMLSRRAVAMAHAQHGRVDCVGASKGLFFGLLLLVGSLICLILFFVLIHHPDLGLLAIYLADVSHCVLMVLSIFAIIIGFIRVQHLKFRSEEQSDLNDILLRVSAFGLFIYAVFSVISGSLGAFTKEPNLLVMVTGILAIVQVVLQLLFIADVARRRVHLPEHDRSKPGRQVVTFLLICNVTMWIIYTFEMQKVEANPVQLDFYGFIAWAIVQRVTLPLCIFHRFHSAVTLAEIWKTSYKARLE